LLEISETIQQAGARFRSLSAPWADTTSPANKMGMTIFSGIADYAERTFMQSHTAEGAV
jgi:DNA invertase Pin-like site-specific DNA recombinase